MTPLELNEINLAASRHVSWKHLQDVLAEIATFEGASEEWLAMLKRRARTLWREWLDACEGQRKLYREVTA